MVTSWTKNMLFIILSRTLFHLTMPARKKERITCHICDKLSCSCEIQQLNIVTLFKYEETKRLWMTKWRWIVVKSKCFYHSGRLFGVALKKSHVHDWNSIESHLPWHGVEFMVLSRQQVPCKQQQQQQQHKHKQPKFSIHIILRCLNK